MVIDEETKVIFLHNPKCGGTFFRNSHYNSRHNNAASDYFKLYDEELNVDLGHVNLGNLPRFIPDYQDYRVISFVRNPCNRFVTALKTASIHRIAIKEMCDRYEWDIKRICNYLLSLNYSEQDMFLRNPSIPWLNPQSNYVNSLTIILRFESLSDWHFLMNIFKVTNADIYIRLDYEMDDETKTMIRELYFDDEMIFSMYE